MTRDRGSYGPLERDQPCMIAWGADRAVDYAQSRVIDSVLQPALPAIDLVARSRRAADRLWTGTRLIGGRGGAERAPAVVGQELFHTVADRTLALASLSTGFQALANDLAVWQTANRDAPNATATAQWLAADVTPTLDEWRSFVERESRSVWTRIATSWDTFEEWWNRLRQLRSLARAHGIALESPEPAALPKTVWQKSAEGKGSEATAILGIMKIAALTVITIMGAVGAYSVFRQLRPKYAADNREIVRDVLREELQRMA